MITPGQGTWQLETHLGAVMSGAAAEHVREGIPVLASYCDALGVRAFADGKDLAADLAETTFSAMASLVDKPLINLESAISHPCQALADWKTMDDLGVPRSGRFVLSWAYHPRPLPLAVPATAVHMAALRGMEVVVLRPEGFALPPPIMEKARRAAVLSGGSVQETADRDEALSGAQIIYAKEWGATSRYGDAAADARLRGELNDWCIRKRLVHAHCCRMSPDALPAGAAQRRRGGRRARQPAQHRAAGSLQSPHRADGGSLSLLKSNS